MSDLRHQRFRDLASGHFSVSFLILFFGLITLGISTKSVGNTVRIELPVHATGHYLVFFLECAREYERLHPGVTIDIYGDPRVYDKIRVRLLEGNLPDITLAGGINYTSLIRQGKILPLNEFLDGPSWEGDGTWRQSFLSGVLDRYIVDGQAYGIPLMYSVNVVWYNRAMFSEHGWHLPRTWDEFFALCNQIKAAGITPLAFQGRYPAYIRGWVEHTYYQIAGPEAFAAQQKLAPGSFNNPQLRETLDLIQRTALNYFQTGAMGMSATEAQLEFFKGHTAMVPCGPWLKDQMEGNIPDDFQLGIFAYPLPDSPHADPGAMRVNTRYYFVTQSSPNARRAVDFLRFLTSKSIAAQYVRQRGVPVVIRNVNGENLPEDMQELAVMIENAHTNYGDPPGEMIPELSQSWQDVRTQILIGEMTPDQGAAIMERAAETIRNRLRDPDRVTVHHRWKPILLLTILGGTVLLAIGTTTVRLRQRHLAARTGFRSVNSHNPINLKSLGVFLTPAIVLYSVFVVFPSLSSFAWSLQRWDGLTDMRYVGLQHFYRLLFESDGFWIALANNLFIMFVIPLFVVPLALFLAACISRGIGGAALFRVVFFFPNLLGVAAILLWQQLYNPQGGPINVALTGMGFESFSGFPWLSQMYLYWALIPMFIWGACGFHMVLYLAAMQSVPTEIYEAAEIDGASPWRQFWTMTLPLIWEVLSISLVFMVIGGMKTFEVIWLLTEQLPTTNTHVIGTRMVAAMFTEFRMGEAAAIAVLLFLMVFFGTSTTLRLLRRETVEF